MAVKSAIGKDAEFDRLIAEAAAHDRAGRSAEAEAAYRAALAIRPDHAAVIHNLGVLAAGRGDRSAAVAWFDAAIRAQPGYVMAHYNRGAALNALGQRAAAIAAFGRAAKLEPDHYASHRALGFLFLAEGNRGRALDHFARTYELRRGDDRNGMALKSLTHSTRVKLMHDAEQLRYLAQNQRDARRFETMARNYEAVGRDFPVTVTPLSDCDFELLGESYNGPINLHAAPEIADGILDMRWDRDEVARQFRRGNGIACLDDLLTPRGFASFRRFLLESTIWHDFSHIAGFVAAYLEDGLACPLLLQIVDELRQALPDVLADRPLSQAWAFKAVEPDGAVDVHADDGAVSVNFWMTPNDANIDLRRGGLSLCTVPPPPEWRIEGYDEDRGRAVTFLERHGRSVLTVPYRENRATLFPSRLLHFSDAPEFAKTYENHRINVTLLFAPSHP